MSVINNPVDGPAQDHLGPIDPHGHYEFETVVDVQDTNQNEFEVIVTGSGENAEASTIKTNQTPDVSRQLHATRTYNDVTNISPVWMFNSEVASILEHLINMRVVDQESGEEIENRGIEVTIVFEADRAGGYNPVDILLGDTSINEYNVSAGFWQINDHLASIMQTQTRGIVATQIPYDGS